MLLAFALAHAGAAELAASIDALLADPALKHGIQGVVIESLASGRVLYERNRDLVFIPASNFKLVVSAASLDRLGPDCTFATQVYMSGRLDAHGVLDGDLILVGGGDPVLSSDDLRALAAEVIGKGIRRITGQIIADESRFDDVRLGWGWSWDDEPFYYSAQISALSVDRNVVGVYVYPGAKEGDPVRIGLRPPSGYFRIESTARTGAPKSENTIYVDRERGKNLIRISGSMPIDFKTTKATELITMENPALYAATLFKDMLGRSGVRAAGSTVIGKKPDGAELLAEHKSPPLSKILALLNKPSDNLIAEMLLKNLGAEIKGKGTAAAGEEVELDFLKTAGADMSAISINDASGLSRLDYISPGNLVALLKHMWRHKHSRVFLDSLPIAGVDGTLRSRMKGTPAQNNVRAKDGYISRVSTLSGYVTTRSGEPLVFSIMMNGHLCPASDAKRVQNSICVLLAELP